MGRWRWILFPIDPPISRKVCRKVSLNCVVAHLLQSSPELILCSHDFTTLIWPYFMHWPPPCNKSSYGVKKGICFQWVSCFDVDCSAGQTRKYCSVAFSLFPFLLDEEGTEIIDTTIGERRWRCYSLFWKVSHVLFTFCSTKTTTYHALGDETPHNWVCVSYPVLTSNHTECDASACMGNVLMGVTDNEALNETSLWVDNRILEILRELLRYVRPYTNVNDSILI